MANIVNAYMLRDVVRASIASSIDATSTTIDQLMCASFTCDSADVRSDRTHECPDCQRRNATIAGLKEREAGLREGLHIVEHAFGVLRGD